MISCTKVRINIEIPNKNGIYNKKTSVILIEGKKEDVAKRLKQKFEYDGPFIDRMLSVDPTGYKYVDYIGKQLEKIIPQLAGQKGGLNFSQKESIQNILGLVIPWFHKNFNKITEDDIWRAESLHRNLHNIVPNIENISRAFKDINQYENPEFLRTLMNVVNSRKTEREIEREAKSQAERIYEDDEVLVIKPKSHAASCYYGSNTKWCTTTAGNTNYFEKYMRSGVLYYFINKKSNEKYALYRNTDNKTNEVYNSQDNLVKLEELREKFPNQNDLIDQLVGANQFIKSLREFSKGVIDERELKESDDSIRKVDTYRPLGQSEVFIQFEKEEQFFKALDLSEDDIWFLNMITGSYSDYEFMDYYTVEEDYKNGYILSNLNKENLEKVKTISKLILPEYEFDIGNEEFEIKLNATLQFLFEKQIDNILYEYVSYKNSEMMDFARESVRKEINEALESCGYEMVTQWDEIKTTVANMVMWSTQLELYRVDAISLFNQILEYKRITLGGWAENTYEFQNSDYFDDGGFNREVERNLDAILEIIEDDMESEDGSLKNFIEMSTRILDKFKINKWYKLPKDDTVRFKIESFDRDDTKIVVMLERGFNMKRLKLSEENFRNLLYQPELFDRFEN